MPDIRLIVLTSQNETILLTEPTQDSQGELRPKFYLEEESSDKINVVVLMADTEPVVLKMCTTKKEAEVLLSGIIADYVNAYGLFYTEISCYD